jgi:hypothetical protein
MISGKWCIKPKNNCFISILLVLLKNKYPHTNTQLRLLQHSAPHTQEWNGSPSAAAAAQNTKHKTSGAYTHKHKRRNVPVCNLFICNVI